MCCSEQTQNSILSCPSQRVTVRIPSLAQPLLRLHSHYTAEGNHKQTKEKVGPSAGCALQKPPYTPGIRIPPRDCQAGPCAAGARIMSEAWGLQSKAAFLMDLRSFSRYLIIHCSGRVVKGVLSFYGLLPQTSPNYKLDLYSGLFIAWPCHLVL